MDDFAKSYGRNYHKMYSMAFQEKSQFLAEIRRIGKLFNLPALDFVPIDPSKNKRNYANAFLLAENKKKQFGVNNDKSVVIKFLDEVEKSRTLLNLGKEWHETIARAVWSGVFMPPPYGIYFSSNKGSNVINMEINCDTTKADLNAAWEDLAVERKRLFGKTRAAYVTEKTIENFNIATSDRIERFNSSNNVDLKSPVDKENIIKLFSNKGGISKKADEKRVSNLRVLRHRLRKGGKIKK